MCLLSFWGRRTCQTHPCVRSSIDAIVHVNLSHHYFAFGQQLFWDRKRMFLITVSSAVLSSLKQEAEFHRGKYSRSNLYPSSPFPLYSSFPTTKHLAIFKQLKPNAIGFATVPKLFWDLQVAASALVLEHFCYYGETERVEEMVTREVDLRWEQSS